MRLFFFGLFTWYTFVFSFSLTMSISYLNSTSPKDDDEGCGACDDCLRDLGKKLSEKIEVGVTFYRDFYEMISFFYEDPTIMKKSMEKLYLFKRTNDDIMSKPPPPNVCFIDATFYTTLSFDDFAVKMVVYRIMVMGKF